MKLQMVSMSTGRIDMKVSEEGKWPEENHWKRYTPDKRDRLMNPFPGVDDIETNWSQTMHPARSEGACLDPLAGCQGMPCNPHLSQIGLD